jgi:hypothetical protein
MTLALVESKTGIIDRAIEIAAKRRKTLLALKTAIRSKQIEEADRLISELVPDEANNRINQSKYRVAGRRR